MASGRTRALHPAGLGARGRRALDLLAPARASCGDATLLELAHARDDEPAPHPWSLWTAICLSRHRPRQLWLLEIVERLSGEPGAIGMLGALAHPLGLPSAGDVPDLPGWHYELHGRGCCLHNREHGELLDVDFYDQGAEHIDPYFYFAYLRSLRAPALPEARLIALHRSIESIALAIDELVASGLLVRHASGHVFRLGDDALALHGLVEQLCQAWSEPGTRPLLAAALGDWLAAAELRPDLEPLVARARACRDERLRDLDGKLADERVSRFALAALGDIDPARYRDRLRDVLRAAGGRLISVALGAALDDPALGRALQGAVRELHARLEPEQQPADLCAATRLLLEHGEPHVGLMPKLLAVAALERCRGFVGNPNVAEVALILLEHQPTLALPLVRRALRSETPACRERAAATLALIGEPWCVRELEAALEASHDGAVTAPCRAALRLLGEVARAIALRWEERHPAVPEGGPLYSFADLATLNAESWLQATMAELGPRVERIRRALPAGFADG